MLEFLFIIFFKNLSWNKQFNLLIFTMNILAY